MNPKDIIIRPIITEKSMAGMQVAEGESVKYTFEVDKNANKIEIAINISAGTENASDELLITNLTISNI